MTTYKVYSPFGGTVWGYPGYYCNSPDPHNNTEINFIDPIDITSPAGTSIVVRLSTVMCINVEYRPTGHCISCTTDPYDYGIKIHLYTDKDCIGFIGSIFYLHVAQPRIAQGNYWTNLLTIGQVASIPSCNPCACRNCYPTGHVHHEMYSGGHGYYNSTKFCSANCGQSITTSDWVYEWIW